MILDLKRDLSRTMDTTQKRLLNDNFDLIERCTKAYIRKSDMYYEDVLMAAALGLFQAATRFDDTKGEFRPFASKTVCGHVLHCLRDVRQTYTDDGVVKYVSTISLNEFINKSPELKIQDCLPADSDDALDKEKDAEKLIAQILAMLSPSEKQVAEVMLNLSDKSYTEIARDLNVTPSAVSQLKSKIENKIIIFLKDERRD